MISSNSDGFDLYRARIRLENGSTQETLRVRLPSPAVLQAATELAKLWRTDRLLRRLEAMVVAADRRRVALLRHGPASRRADRDHGGSGDAAGRTRVADG